MLFWILIILVVHGGAAFAYAVATAPDHGTAWAMFSMSFIFCLGITQTGVAFSAIMRITKSKWGMSFGRLGEILTLSFIPVVAIMFAVIYLGGMEDLFYWAAPHAEGVAAHGRHISPWLGKGLFFWRFVITTSLFYLASYVYFSMGRREEVERKLLGTSKKMSNVAPAFVCFFYVIANSNLAWDFGMTAIRHWESSIFAPYFWSGNLLSGSAFLFLISLIFIARDKTEKYDKHVMDAVGKLLLGFVLLVTYMFWSQHIVIWYGGLPARTGPLFKQMRGAYGAPFVLMILAILVVPFLALLFRRLKLQLNGLVVISIVVIGGILINRYLMIVPIYSDGDISAPSAWAGIALVAAVISAALLSVKCFTLLFPDVTLSPCPVKKDH